MKFIRISGLAIFAILFGGIVGGSMFFAESLIKNYAEKTLTESNGAKVDIESVMLEWSPLSLKLNDIQITDQQNPMINALVIQQVAFVVSLADLLLGKLIIEDMSVTGVRMDAARSESGAVVFDDNDVAVNSVAADDEWFEMPGIDLPDVKDILRNEPLNSEVIFKTLDADLSKTNASWKKIKKDLTDKQRWDSYDQKYRQIQSGIKGDFTKKIAAVTLAKSLSKELKSENKRFNDAKATFKSDLARIEDEFKQAKAAPGNDYRRLKNKFSGDSLNAENITQMLFGSQTSQYVALAKKWYARVEPYLGDEDEEAVVIHKRGEGVNITFEEYDPKPGLLIRLISIDAQTPRGDFSGSIKNISSDQSINKQAMTFKLSGQGLLDRKLEQIEGEFNYINKRAGFTQIYYQINQQHIKNYDISKSDAFSLNMNRALMDFRLSARLEKGRIKGDARFDFKQVEFKSSKKTTSSALTSLMAASFSDIKYFNVLLAYDGSLKDINVDIKSDLDNQLGDALKQKIKHKKKVFESELRAEIDKKLKHSLDKIEAERQKLYAIKAEIKAKEVEFKQKLASLKNTINSEKNIRKEKLEYLKNAEKAKLKSKVDAEKKHQQDKLKQQLKNKFKNYFN